MTFAMNVADYYPYILVEEPWQPQTKSLVRAGFVERDAAEAYRSFLQDDYDNYHIKLFDLTELDEADQYLLMENLTRGYMHFAVEYRPATKKITVQPTTRMAQKLSVYSPNTPYAILGGVLITETANAAEQQLMAAWNTISKGTNA